MSGESTIRWWKRLIYSFVSMLMAAAAFGAFVEIQNLLDRNSHFEVSDMVWAIYPVLIFCIPGWLLAVPIVLAATDFRGWRVWFFLAVGSCIGPIVILGFAAYGQLIDPHSGGAWANGSGGFLILAAAVSFITTLIYLLLIRAVPLPRASN
jgi:hypothetical protein